MASGLLLPLATGAPDVADVAVDDAVVLRLPNNPLCGDVLCGGEDFCWFCVCGPFFSLTAASRDRNIFTIHQWYINNNIMFLNISFFA